MQKYLESAPWGLGAERLDQPIAQRVMRKVIEDIRSCNFATVECVIENCETPARVPTRSAMPIRAARALFDPERRRSLDAGTVLSRGILATCGKPDVKRNRYNVYWSTQHFVIQRLYELRRYGPEHIQQRARVCGEYQGKRSIYRVPTNNQMARWLVPKVAKVAARKLRKSKERWHWQIELRRSQQPLYCRPESIAASDFMWLDSPRGKFWADPFLIERGGATWVFFEN